MTAACAELEEGEIIDSCAHQQAAQQVWTVSVHCFLHLFQERYAIPLNGRVYMFV